MPIGHCTCGSISCRYCNPVVAEPFKSMFRDWRDGEIERLREEVAQLKEKNAILTKCNETGYDPFEAGKRVGARKANSGSHE